MGQNNDYMDNIELLLRLSQFGEIVSDALRKTAGGIDVTDNVSIHTMCLLEVSGPLRPNDLVELTGLTSGGVTKVVTRLETVGLVTRTRCTVPEDRRAVEVALTDKGHGIMHSFARELGLRISDASVLVKELNRLVG